MFSERSQPAPTARIAAVVVTYNRFALLKACIDAIRRQTRPPDEIIVVNNGSTDETEAWLAQQSNLTIITQANQGSSGGQHTGFDRACRRGHQWIWCMDDDTVPAPQALERLVTCPKFSDPETGFLGSLVVWTDGTAHRMNAPNPIDQVSWFHSVLTDGCVRVSFCSFVSMIVRREAVERVGLPLKEMFIWFDDVEFTRRVGARYKGYVVLDSIAEHRTPKNAGPPDGEVKLTDLLKYCYGVRNQVLMHRRAQAPLFDRLVEIAKLFRRQITMVARGKAPPQVLMWAARGLLFSPPVDFPGPDERDGYRP